MLLENPMPRCYLNIIFIQILLDIMDGIWKHHYNYTNISSRDLSVCIEQKIRINNITGINFTQGSEAWVRGGRIQELEKGTAKTNEVYITFILYYNYKLHTKQKQTL
jgi:hypothetical protein